MKRHAKVTISDKQSNAVWECDAFQKVGPTLGLIRNETPAGFDWKAEPFVSMTRAELMTRINSRLRKDERPITINMIARLENGMNVYGGYLMRIVQITRALHLDLFMRKTK